MNKQTTQVTDEQIDKLFQGIDTVKLGTWEKEFVESTRSYWTRNRRLSEKQSKRLIEIWKGQNEPRSA